jgi:tRNA dimethylallyltransferase
VNSKKLVVIVGPTAVGKTAVSVKLAGYFETEIISADSRQIFKELEIGTAKPSKEELNQVKHHFINTHSIAEVYDAGVYGDDALELINQLFKKYDTLILCGGSGLYVKALLEGFDEMPKVKEGIREWLVKQYKVNGLKWLQQKVKELDPDYFAKVDIQNPQRLMRALELLLSSSKKMDELRQQKKRELSFKIIKVGLELEREKLYERIDQRMDLMISEGLFEEAKLFFDQRNLNALQTVGYTEIFDFMSGLYDREEAIRLLKRNSRRYAKRQLTWFKRDEEIKWFNPNQIDAIIQLIKNG